MPPPIVFVPVVPMVLTPLVITKLLVLRGQPAPREPGSLLVAQVRPTELAHHVLAVLTPVVPINRAVVTGALVLRALK